MNITLEMVDDVIKRTGVGYNVAKTALEASDGDLLQAILDIEVQETQKASSHSIPCIVDWMKKLIQEGLVRQILVEKDGKTVLDVPIVAGAIAGAFFTKTTLFAVAAAFATGCQVYLVKKEGSKVHINAFASTSYETIKQIFTAEEKEGFDASLQTADTVIKS